MNDVIKLINSVPELFKYFIPGAICLKVFYFLRSTSEEDYEYYIFKSIIVSGILFYPLKQCIRNKNEFNLFVCSIGLGIVVAFVVTKIMEWEMTQVLLQKLHIRKTVRSFWEDVIDLEHGSYAEIKIRDDENRYYGTVEYLEDKEEGDIYISIKDYTIETEDGQRIKQKNDTRLVFNTVNIEHMSFRRAQK